MKNYKLEKWKRWINRIRMEFTELSYYDQIFSTTKGLYLKNHKLLKIDNFTFYDFISAGYISIAALAIRRQIKSKEKSVSLLGLLHDIAENPKYLSRKYFLQFYKYDYESESVGNQFFNDMFGENAEFANPKSIEKQIDKLKKECSCVETFVDKRLAHSDLIKGIFPPSFIAIEKAMKEICNIIKNYYLLLVGSDMLIRPWVADNWINIFRENWFEINE
jgi:hypothetical protein